MTHRTAMATNPDSNVVKFPTFDATWDEDERVNLYNELAASWAIADAPRLAVLRDRSPSVSALSRAIAIASVALSLFIAVYFACEFAR